MYTYYEHYTHMVSRSQLEQCKHFCSAAECVSVGRLHGCYESFCLFSQCGIPTSELKLYWGGCRPNRPPCIGRRAAALPPDPAPANYEWASPLKVPGSKTFSTNLTNIQQKHDTNLTGMTNMSQTHEQQRMTNLVRPWHVVSEKAARPNLSLGAHDSCSFSM